MQALILLGAAAFGFVRAGGSGAGNPQRLVSVGDVQIVEGDSGTRLAVFTVTLAAQSDPEGLRFAYRTVDGSASASSDYVPTAGVMTFPAPATPKTVAVPIVGDTAFEPDETFSLEVTRSYGASIADAVGVATIVNDDPEPVSPTGGGSPGQSGGVPPARADLELAVSASRTTATVGQEIVYTAAVTNRGPGQATAVTLVDTLPVGLTFRSAAVLARTSAFRAFSAQISAACSGTTTVTCPLGTLAAGSSVTLALTTTAAQAGTFVNNISVAAAEPDPTPANNAGQSTAQVTPLTPVQGKLFVGRPVTGVVLVNGKPLVAARTIPVGARIDTRRGTIDLQATTGRGKFNGGLFQIRQKRKKRAIAVLGLVGGNFKKVCGTRVLAAEVRRKQPSVRHLWGNGKGQFRTEGRYASATIRGTVWDVEDRCDGTLVLVRKGRVSVFDKPLRKTVLVTTGHSYLARKP